jgi:hypothetical protein
MLKGIIARIQSTGHLKQTYPTPMHFVPMEANS